MQEFTIFSGLKAVKEFNSWLKQLTEEKLYPCRLDLYDLGWGKSQGEWIYQDRILAWFQSTITHNNALAVKMAYTEIPREFNVLDIVFRWLRKQSDFSYSNVPEPNEFMLHLGLKQRLTKDDPEYITNILELPPTLPSKEPPVRKGRSLQIFLSCPPSDKLVVRELYGHLKADGFDPWLDEENLLGGQDPKLETEKALRRSDILLICLSKKFSAEPSYAHREMKMALDKAAERPEGEVYLIPLRLDHCVIPFALSNLLHIDYFKEDGYQKLVKSLKARAEEIGKAV